MNFEWDEGKNEINIDKHGFDFADAHRIFDLPMAIELDERNDYGEDRWIGTGNAGWSGSSGGLYRTQPRNNSYHLAQKSSLI